VNHEDAIKRLRALRDEAATLPPSTSSAEFNSWEPRTRSALTRALGEKHYITQRFIKTKWTPSAYGRGDTIAFTSTFRGTVPEAQGILDAAIAEIELLAEEGRFDGSADRHSPKERAPPQTNPGTVTTGCSDVSCRSEVGKTQWRLLRLSTRAERSA
jgi:hypothetical protein